MSLESVVKKTWSDNILFSALVELTYRCNLDCYFCYNDLGLKGTPLSAAQYVRFFEDLRDMQVLYLVLSGGEPLAHPDFFFLGRKARELGFLIRIKSNGHALRGPVARRIKEEVDPFVVELSLHGARSKTHERQTRVAGSFERLIANVREMLGIGLRVKMNSTLTAYNEDEIAEMFDLADRLGVPLQFDPDVTPRDNGDMSVLSIRASAEGLRTLFRLETQRAEKARERIAASGAEDSLPREVMRQADGGLPPSGDKHCGAGSSGIAVDPYGNVYPCVQWRRPAGNLHETSVKEIWAGSAALAEVRALTVEVKKVVDGHGPGGQYMAFCPGLAAMLTGSPLRVPPSALARRDIAHEVRGERRLIRLPVLP
jgi:MoaA/NifB/PqqE/SkfB family radical SAM enzyme